MSDYEELREEMQYYENEHYNELRKLEAEENASPTLKADRDAWKARAEKAEAELKKAVKDIIKCSECKHKDTEDCPMSEIIDDNYTWKTDSKAKFCSYGENEGGEQ